MAPPTQRIPLYVRFYDEGVSEAEMNMDMRQAIEKSECDAFKFKVKKSHYDEKGRFHALFVQLIKFLMHGAKTLKLYENYVIMFGITQSGSKEIEETAYIHVPTKINEVRFAAQLRGRLMKLTEYLWIIYRDTNIQSDQRQIKQNKNPDNVHKMLSVFYGVGRASSTYPDNFGCKAGINKLKCEAKMEITDRCDYLNEVAAAIALERQMLKSWTDAYHAFLVRPSIDNEGDRMPHFNIFICTPEMRKIIHETPMEGDYAPLRGPAPPRGMGTKRIGDQCKCKFPNRADKEFWPDPNKGDFVTLVKIWLSPYTVLIFKKHTNCMGTGAETLRVHSVTMHALNTQIFEKLILHEETKNTNLSEKAAMAREINHLRAQNELLQIQQSPSDGDAVSDAVSGDAVSDAASAGTPGAATPGGAITIDATPGAATPGAATLSTATGNATIATAVTGSTIATATTGSIDIIAANNIKRSLSDDEDDDSSTGESASAPQERLKAAAGRTRDRLSALVASAWSARWP